MLWIYCAVAILCVLLLFAGYAAYVWLHKDRFTRARFAFAGLGLVGLLATHVVLTLTSGVSPWAAIWSALNALSTGQPAVPSSNIEGMALACLVLIAMMVFVWRLHAGWDGAVTVQQAERRQRGQPADLLSEGLAELRRLAKRIPEEVYQPGRAGSRFGPLVYETPSLQFRDLAREVICERWPDIEIDKEAAWHTRGRCWIGYDPPKDRHVVLICPDESLSENDRSEIVNYLQSLPKLKTSAPDIFHIKIHETEISPDVSPWELQSETLDEALDKLLRLGDYRRRIRDRFCKEHLPNSEVTLQATFTSSTVYVEHEPGKPQDLEGWLDDWLRDNGQSHLALLGEYGRGKTTNAIALTFRLLGTSGMPRRLPLLIELRGRHPHRQPEEILGEWAAPYGFSARSLMLLHQSGRLLIIFEGFDEMRDVGSERARHECFRYLWAFSSYNNAKILFTGRPELFLDDRELRLALGVHIESATGPHTVLLHLAPFSIQQMAAALRNTTPEVRDSILLLARTDPAFCDIAARPSLLHQLSTVWQDSEIQKAGSRINSAVVIRRFLYSTFSRQAEKVRNDASFHFMNLNQNELEFFTIAVALRMAAARSPNQISGPEITELVGKVWTALDDTVEFPARPDLGEQQGPIKVRFKDDTEPVEHVTTNIRTHGVLVRDYSTGENTFQFAHKSYLEMIVAEQLALHLLGEQEPKWSLLVNLIGLDISALLRDRWIREFFVQVIAYRPSIATLSIERKRALLRKLENALRFGPFGWTKASLVYWVFGLPMILAAFLAHQMTMRIMFNQQRRFLYQYRKLSNRLTLEGPPTELGYLYSERQSDLGDRRLSTRGLSFGMMLLLCLVTGVFSGIIVNKQLWYETSFTWIMSPIIAVGGMIFGIYVFAMAMRSSRGLDTQALPIVWEVSVRLIGAKAAREFLGKRKYQIGRFWKHYGTRL